MSVGSKAAKKEREMDREKNGKTAKSLCSQKHGVKKRRKNDGGRDNDSDHCLVSVNKLLCHTFVMSQSHHNGILNRIVGR